MFINSSNSDDEKETIILPDNERERKRREEKKQIVVYHHFLPIFFASLCFLSMSFFLCLSIKPKKRKRKKDWSLCVLKHVDALSTIEQVNNASLNFICRSTERTSTLKRDKENLEDKVVKANLPSTTDTKNMNPQEIRINYIFLLFLL